MGDPGLRWRRRRQRDVSDVGQCLDQASVKIVEALTRSRGVDGAHHSQMEVPVAARTSKGGIPRVSGQTESLSPAA